MEQAAHERSRRHHDRATAKTHSEIGLHTRRCVVLNEKPGNVALLKIKTRLLLKEGLDAKLISLFVTLGARSPDARPLARVQHPKLDAGGVGIEPHHAAERVDFPDHVALRKTADRGIARHLADRIGVLGEHQGLAAKPRRGHRRFNAGMARANDNHVVRLGIIEFAHFK